MIKSSGHRISPLEIEEAALGSGVVAEGGGSSSRSEAAAAAADKGDEGNRRRSLAMDFIRTLHYAPRASRPEAGELGCGAHCD